MLRIIAPPETVKATSAPRSGQLTTGLPGIGSVPELPADAVNQARAGNDAAGHVVDQVLVQHVEVRKKDAQVHDAQLKVEIGKVEGWHRDWLAVRGRREERAALASDHARQDVQMPGLEWCRAQGE